jgi:hypothetical protein
VRSGTVIINGTMGNTVTKTCTIKQN